MTRGEAGQAPETGDGPRQAAGEALPPGTRVAVVVARWNESITSRLLDGALVELAAAGLGSAAVDVAWVPGSFELPFAADRLAAEGRYAAVLCLGAIIRGETTHDRVIAAACAQGIESAARARGVPLLFGVLTCESLAQALARAGDVRTGGDPRANKGVECAAAAVEMIRFMARLSRPAGRPT